jgi:hypothetical protein
VTYAGDVLEDLKQATYALSAFSRQYPEDRDLQRYADATNHALQILDSNRKIVNAYELEHRNGMQAHREPDSIVPSPGGLRPGQRDGRF